MSTRFPNQVYFEGSSLVDPIGSYPTAFTRIRWVYLDPASYTPGYFPLIDDPTSFSNFDYYYIGSFGDGGETWRQVIYLAIEGNPAYEPIWDGGTGTDYFGPTAIDCRNGWTMLCVALDEAALTVQLFDKQGATFRGTNVLSLPNRLARNAPISRYGIGGSAIDQGPFDWLGWFGPVYDWRRKLSAAEVQAQARQIAPVSRDGLILFNPGLDQPMTRNFANNTTGLQFGTSGGIAATNPPIPWTAGLLL